MKVLKRIVCFFIGCVDSNEKEKGVHESICSRCGKPAWFGITEY